MNFMCKSERLTTLAVSGIARLIGYMPVLLMTQVLAQFGFQSSFHRQFGEMLHQAFFAYQILWILVIG